MGKLSISKLIDTSKFLSSKAGQELRDFIVYVSDFSEQVIRTLNGGLTFQDNFNAKISTVEFSDGAAQVINTDSKQPIGIIPIRVVSTSYKLNTCGWYINDNGQTVVTLGFTGSPTNKVSVTLAILF